MSKLVFKGVTLLAGALLMTQPIYAMDDGQPNSDFQHGSIRPAEYICKGDEFKKALNNEVPDVTVGEFIDVLLGVGESNPYFLENLLAEHTHGSISFSYIGKMKNFWIETSGYQITLPFSNDEKRKIRELYNNENGVEGINEIQNMMTNKLMNIKSQYGNEKLTGFFPPNGSVIYLFQNDTNSLSLGFRPGIKR